MVLFEKMNFKKFVSVETSSDYYRAIRQLRLFSSTEVVLSSEFHSEKTSKFKTKMKLKMKKKIFSVETSPVYLRAIRLASYSLIEHVFRGVSRSEKILAQNFPHLRIL